MSDNRIFNELVSLERKFEILLNEHQLLKAEIKKLEGENDQLKTVISSREEALDNFHNSAKISKLVGTVGADESDTAEMKKSIDQYIKELDKCIAHLSR